MRAHRSGIRSGVVLDEVRYSESYTAYYYLGVCLVIRANWRWRRRCIDERWMESISKTKGRSVSTASISQPLSISGVTEKMPDRNMLSVLLQSIKRGFSSSSPIYLPIRTEVSIFALTLWYYLDPELCHNGV